MAASLDAETPVARQRLLLSSFESIARMERGPGEAGNDAPFRARTRRILSLGRRLVAGHRVAGTVDISRMVKALGAELQWGGWTPAERGVIASGALVALDEDLRGCAAIALTHVLTPAGLPQLGRAGLLDVRLACSLAGEELASAALRSLEQALDGLGDLPVVDVDGLIVIVDGVGRLAQRKLLRRLFALRAQGRSPALSGSFVLVVGAHEERTDPDLLWRCAARVLGEHPSYAGDRLSRARAQGEVLVLDEARILRAWPRSMLGRWRWLGQRARRWMSQLALRAVASLSPARAAKASNDDASGKARRGMITAEKPVT